MIRHMLVLCACLVSVPVCAQEWASPSARHGADVASTVGVAGTIGADVAAQLMNGGKAGVWHAVACEGMKYALVNGASIGLKKVFPRERPDGSDNQDSFSEHTANAFASTGWHAGISIPVASLVGYLRTASGRHDKTGVVEGMGLGVGARFLITHLSFCKGVS